MTKIKNTKKGMAKKTLSISLVAAMLATSNVPVWATEFSDGSDTVVEFSAGAEEAAPAEAVEAAEEFTSEAPVVEEVTVQEAGTEATTNVGKYDSSGFKIDTTNIRWGSEVIASGAIKKEDGTNILQDGELTVEYAWLLDGRLTAHNEEQQQGELGENLFHYLTGEEKKEIENVTDTNGAVLYQTWQGYRVRNNDGEQYVIFEQEGGYRYTPVREDYNHELSLQITVKRANETVFQQIFDGGKVGAKDISAEIFPTTTITTDDGKEVVVGVDFGIDPETTFNGEEQRLRAGAGFNVEYDVDGDGDKENITKYLDWNYSQAGKTGADVTNCTPDENPIVVTATLNGNVEEVYGYYASSDSVLVRNNTYKIVPAEIKTGNNTDNVATNDTNLIVTLNKESGEYTGAAQEFGKSDVQVVVKIDDTHKVDITEYLSDKFSITGETNVSQNNELQIILKGTDFKSIPKNFKVKDASNTDAYKTGNDTLTDADLTATVKATNKYNIIARDLNNCTAEVLNAKLGLLVPDGLTTDKDTISKNVVTNYANVITLKGKSDGKTITYDKLMSYANLTVEEPLVEAVKQNKKGLVKDAITISYTNAGEYVTGKVSVDVMLSIDVFSNLTLTAEDDEQKVLKDDKTDENIPTLGTYNGKEQKPKISVSGDGIEVGNYTLKYSENINAGTATVTVEGAVGTDFEGCKKDFYFNIDKATIDKDKHVTMKDKVVVNASNDLASKYEKALELSLKKDVALEKDKDYTVKYYFVTEAGKATVDQATDKVVAIKTVAGAEGAVNKADNYIYAVAKIDGKGNYNTGTFIKSAKIVRKSLSGAEINLEKDSYVYTGDTITPEVVVKYGSQTLEKGEDYVLHVTNNKNVGTATVIIEATAGSEFEEGTKVTKTFQITPANAQDVAVELIDNGNKATLIKSNTFAYNKGKQIQPKVTRVTLNGVDVTKEFDIINVTYGDNNTAGKEAGSVIIAPKAENSNFTGTKTQLFDIQGTELTGELKIYDSNKNEIRKYYSDEIEFADKHFYYSGEACTFADAAFLPSKDILAVKEGTDYEIKYINNVKAGVGFIAVVAKGNYEGKCNSWTGGNGSGLGYKVEDGVLYQYNYATGSRKALEKNIVDIVAIDIRATMVTAKNITVANGVYASGLPVKPQVTVSVAGRTLTEGKDYKLTVEPVDMADFDDYSYPESYINATDGKKFYVTVTPVEGYLFDNVEGYNRFTWGIDKFDLAAADIQTSGDQVVVKNGTIVVDPADYTVTKDEAAGTITVAATEGNKNYTGSQTVKTNNVYVQAPVIKEVKVVGNKATVVLSGDCEGADGYDYVISKANDYKTNRVDVNKNKLTTDTDFDYVQSGVYYAYCHAWTRGADGKKIFSGWSNIHPFAVTAITPDQPVISSVKVSGSTVTVTYTEAANADGYDVVLGTEIKAVNGEKRPVEYGKLVKKNIKDGVVTATFKNVPKGTYYAGLHAFNRTSEDGKKVFSPWSNTKKVTVK